jgi:CRP/FNR family transcriptional regulator, nitrogen oxide reductase regulator
MSVSLLATIGLLNGLPTSAQEDLVAAARFRSIPKDMRIFDQGEPAERAHALLSGALRISQTGSDGGEFLIRFIGAGEMFGAATICTDQLYPADATAMIDSLEASWDQAELLALMKRHSDIALNMLAIIGARLGEAQERLRELATQSADRRIARTVLRLLHQAGRQEDAGFRIDFPLLRKDIADIAGTTLHTASRILADWERRGWLVSRNRHLILCSPDDVRRIAEGTIG